MEFTAAARRDIAKLPDRVAWAILEFCSGPLAENPYRVGRPLVRELTGLYSAHRGGYRIVYTINDDRVLVEIAYVRRRADAYRPH